MLPQIDAEEPRIVAILALKAALPHKLELGVIFKALDQAFEDLMHPVNRDTFRFGESPADPP
jgi:hypothetical protein